jgi:hypothetical protein
MGNDVSPLTDDNLLNSDVELDRSNPDASEFNSTWNSLANADSAAPVSGTEDEVVVVG